MKLNNLEYKEKKNIMNKTFEAHHKPNYLLDNDYQQSSQMLDNNDHLYNYFDLNWTLTDIEQGVKGFVRDPQINEKPNNLNLMIEYAKKLSNEFVFVRVDFYEINNTVYLSEMTFSPSDNHMKFKNREQSIYLGSLLDISKIRPYLFNH